jgi:hypothetical protein
LVARVAAGALGFLIFIGLSRALRTQITWAKGKKSRLKVRPKLKYGTKRADIQRGATIVFAGLSQRADDLYLGLIGLCDDKHSQAVRAKAKTHSTRSSTAWRQL